MLHIIAELLCIDSQNTRRACIIGILLFQNNSLLYQSDNLIPKFLGPYVRVLLPDGVYQVAAEGKMQALIPHDIFKLLPYHYHLILPFKGKHHRKSSIKEDAFHYYIIADKVMDKFSYVIYSICCECRVKNALGKLNHKIILLFYGRYCLVHFVNFLWVKAERVTAVNERISLFGFLVCLPQKVLPAFRIRDLIVNSKHNIVGC